MPYLDDDIPLLNVEEEPGERLKAFPWEAWGLPPLGEVAFDKRV